MYKVFVNGTALTAEVMNDVIAEQVIAVFNDASERNNTIPAPNQGQHCHLLSTGMTYFYKGTSWIELLPSQVSGLTARTLLVCTSTTRPTHAAGREIFETDTKRKYLSDGTTWVQTGVIADGVWLTPDTNWQELSLASGWTKSTGKYRIKDGVYYVTLSAARASWNVGDTLFSVPAEHRPTENCYFTGMFGGVAKEVRVLASTGEVELAAAGSTGVVLSASWVIG